MKVCITAVGNDLNSPIDPRFGRCASFMIVDTESMEFRVLQNRSAYQAGGAGIQAAGDVVKEGISAVISGAIGPNAIEVLRAANVEFYEAMPGSVKDNVEALKAGRLKKMYAPTVPGHFGQGGRGGGHGRRW
jgi:predicted Fe-Mo cluster-binding NifX family protein